MSSDEMAASQKEIQMAQDVAEDIASATRLSKKQATALTMRTVLDCSNKTIADVLGISNPESASSYVSRCREKFNRVDEEIEELEQEIEAWEKTEELEDIFNSLDDSIYALEDKVNAMLNDDEMYLVVYLDEQGEQQIEYISFNPGETNPKHEILGYKKADSMLDAVE